MTDEISKCAWCGKEPERFPRFHDLEDGCICSSKDCPGAIGIPIDATEWNDLQAQILEARRKDFEAGAKKCADSNCISGWYGPDDFDDYIKGE